MTWLWVTIAIGSLGASALVSAALPDRWLERYRAPMLGLATGALLASGLGEVLPEALDQLGALAIGLAAAAMIVLGVIERASSRASHHAKRPIVPFALLGADALHNLGDGMAITGAFLVDARVGIATTLGVLLHEIPGELADYVLLRRSGWSRRTAVLALAGIQLTAGIGAAGALVAASLLESANGVILAIACGTFVYIAAIDLAPDLWRDRSRSGLLAAVVGAAIVLAIL